MTLVLHQKTKTATRGHWVAVLVCDNQPGEWGAGRCVGNRVRKSNAESPARARQILLWQRTGKQRQPLPLSSKGRLLRPLQSLGPKLLSAPAVRTLSRFLSSCYQPPPPLYSVVWVRLMPVPCHDAIGDNTKAFALVTPALPGLVDYGYRSEAPPE